MEKANKERFDEILVPLYSAFSTECYEATGHTINWDEINIAHVRRLFLRFGIDKGKRLINAFYNRLTSEQKKRGWVEPRHLSHNLDDLYKAMEDNEFYEVVMSAVATAEEVHGEKIINSSRMQDWMDHMLRTKTIVPYSSWQVRDA